MTKDWKEYHRLYWQKRRKRIIDYLGGECVICGTKTNLEVDHIDPELKSYSIGQRCSLDKIKEELDKCQLLCETHHREKTAKERSGFTHGTTYAWMEKGCRCEFCKPIWRVWQDKRNLRRRKSPM